MGAATPHKIVEIPGVSYDMDGAGPRFLAEFDTAIQWMSDHPLMESGSGLIQSPPIRPACGFFDGRSIFALPQVESRSQGPPASARTHYPV